MNGAGIMQSDSVNARGQSPRVERYEVVIVGAGQAGLATGHHLAQQDADFVILDGAPAVGHSWRTRWDTLRLFTPARYSSLPGMPFPAPPSHLPDKDETAEYLARYADRFELPTRMDTRVQALRQNGDRFMLESKDCVYDAEQVIVAAGPFQRPRIPTFNEALDNRITQLHSSEYVNPFVLPDGPALVVGAGNSGAQIAIELARFRKVWLAGRNTGHLPRRLLGRDLFDWIWPIMKRATADTRVGRRMRVSAERGGDALIGIPERAVADAGVVRVGRLDEVRAGLPVCNGEVLEPRIIVWCTGFEPDYRWLDLPALREGGYPRHRRGVATDVAGLFFVGLRFQHRITSSLIGGVGLDAAFIAEQIRRKAERPATSAA
jgi:putative flavoprotein involved in K+ transport